MWSSAVLGFIAILGATTALPFKKHQDGRIVGGEYVSIQDFPYQVALLTSNKASECGGSILNKNFVLTAAHCTDSLENGYVRAGSNFTYEGGSLHRIIDIRPHKGFYMYEGVTNDIAILKIDPPFTYDSAIQPIEMYENDDKDVEVGQMATVSGYGSWGSNILSDEKLMATSVPIVSRAKCNRIYRSLDFDYVREDRICAGYTEGGKDSCQGDSGGPLVINGKQVGIVSYGSGCADPDIPGIYANVPYFAQWIKDNTSL